MSNCIEADNKIDNEDKLMALKVRIYKLEDFIRYQEKINNQHFEMLISLKKKLTKLDFDLELLNKDNIII